MVAPFNRIHNLWLYLHSLKLRSISALHPRSGNIKDFPSLPRALCADLLMLWDPIRSKVATADQALGEACFRGKLWLLIGQRPFYRLASGQLRLLFVWRSREALLSMEVALHFASKSVSDWCFWDRCVLSWLCVGGRLSLRLEHIRTLRKWVSVTVSQTSNSLIS